MYVYRYISIYNRSVGCMFVCCDFPQKLLGMLKKLYE